jgi:sulfonate transport system permease protein
MSQVVTSLPLQRNAAPALRRLGAPGRFLSVLVLLLFWEAGSRLGVIPKRDIAAPSTIVVTFVQLLRDGTLEHHMLISLARVAVGLTIALVLGVGLALLAGLSRRGEDAVDAPLQMLRTLPHLALVPLFILWFGIGETPKVALVVLGAVFPIYLTLFAGIRGVDPKLLEMARVLGLSRRAIILQVVLPGALPSALVGLRYAIGIAWLSLVVGEQINADSGIGFMVMDAREFLRTDIIVVGLMVYALLGTASDQAVRWIERRALAWRPAVVGSRA